MLIKDMIFKRGCRYDSGLEIMEFIQSEIEPADKTYGKKN